MQHKHKTIESYIATTFVLIIILGFLIILVLSIFTPQSIEFNVGTGFALLGIMLLAGTGIMSSIGKSETGRSININAEVAIVSFGLAMLVKSQIVSIFFFMVAAFCWVWWFRDAMRRWGLSGKSSEDKNKR